MTTFQLTEKEEKRYNTFIKNLPKKYRNKSKKLIFGFGNGIGAERGSSGRVSKGT